jgi:hypothetical protein
MVAITASPKNFAALIDLQMKANESLQTIQKIMEVDRAIQLANLYETKRIDDDGDRLEEIEQKTLDKVDFESKQQEEILKNIKEIRSTLGDMKEGLLGSTTKPNDLSEKEMDQIKINEKMAQHLENIEKNTSSGPEKDSGPKKESGFFGNLKTGLSSMGNMAKNFLAIAASLWILSKALQNFAKVEWVDIGKASATMIGLGLAARFAGSGDAYKSILALSVGTLGLAFAMDKFAEVEWESIGKAGLIIAGLGLAVRIAGKGGAWKEMLAFSASIIAMAYGLNKFAEVEWESIGKAGAVMAGLIATVSLLKGSAGGVLALLGITAAVWGLGKALENFQNLEWETIGKGLTSLLGIGAIGALAGLVVAPILLGAAALGAMGAALMVIGEGMQMVGGGLESLITGLERLSNISGDNLLGVAKGIGAVSLSLLAFGTAGMITALQSLVSNFLSIGQDSPIDKLEKIGKAGPGIEKAAAGMQKLANALKSFSSINVDNLDKIVKSTDKIGKLGAKLIVVEKALPADQVYRESSDLVNMKPNSAGSSPTTVVAAPTTNVKQTKNYMMNIPVRNQDVSINSFYGSRLMA